VFSINGGELVVLLLVALVVLGPERLPQYASQLAGFVRQARSFALRAREQVRSEMGPEFDDVDWQVLDPRRYDPRRIVREALLEGDDDPFGFDALGSLDDYAFDLPGQDGSDPITRGKSRADDEPDPAEESTAPPVARSGYDVDAT
jgi:sec-independent protein translocase protein TatB